MIQLHDKTRRRIGMAAFGLLCVTPTVLVVAWCIAWQLPSHVGAEAQRLQQQLGLNVALEAVRHPRPGVVLYEGLTLTDPETGQTVLRCPQLEATWTRIADQQGNRHAAVLLSASKPEIEAAALDRLAQLLQTTLQNQASWADMEIQLTASEATLRAGGETQTFSDLHGAIEAIHGGAQARAVFRLADSTALDPIKVRLIRNRESSPPRCRFEVDTGGGQLPCGVLSVGLSSLKSLDSQYRFCGHLSVKGTPGGWTAEASDLSGQEAPAELPQARLLGVRPVIQR